MPGFAVGSIPRASTHQRFARHAGESAFPSLWVGLAEARCFPLGVLAAPVDVQAILPWTKDASWTGATPTIIATEYGYVPRTSRTEYFNVATTYFDGVRGTILVRFRPQSTTETNDYIHGYFTASEEISLHLRFGSIRFSLGGSPNINIGVSASDNVWCHVTQIWDTGNYISYKDGDPAGTGSYTGNPIALGTMSIGGNPGYGASSRFDGDIAEWYAYNRVLSDPEVQWHSQYCGAPFLLRKRWWPQAAAVGGGRIMSSLAEHGGLAGAGGLAGIGGGLAR